jgi:hypothetical protein
MAKTDPADGAVDQDENLDEDTLDDDDAAEQDTPDDAEQPDTDWEARYKESEKLRARQGQELGVWRRGGTPAADRGRKPAAGESTADDADAEGDNEYATALESDSWRAAEAIYGAEAIDAYDAAFDIFERAQTPADYIAAFEAYHEIRSGGGTQEDAADAAADATTKRSRSAAVQPRVDLNRSDAGPDLNDKDVEEARKSGDLGKFVSAATRRMGFGGETRQR